jgi:peptidoglycan/LPS O-acetylase OafA/YrhL
MTAISNSAGNQGASKVLPLTSARFFAALYVVFYHWWPRLPAHRGQHDLLSRVVGLGYVSVSFFFLLSGFILAIVYLKNDRPIPIRKFFISRFARVYPLYAAAIMLDLPHFIHAQRQIVHTSTRMIAGTIVSTFALVQAWFPIFHGLDNPSWSLSAEAFFYLLFPFIGVPLAKLQIRASVLLGIVVYGAGICLVQLLHSDHQTYSPFPYLFVFVLGILLARGYHWVNESDRRRLSMARAAPWMIVFSLFVFLAIPILQVPLSEPLLQHGLLAPLFMLVILALASGNRMLSLILSAPWLVLLGEASFALYLIHEPIGSMFRSLIERFGVPMLLVYVATSVGLSVISLLYLETPCRLWILKKEKVRSRESTVSSSMMQ